MIWNAFYNLPYWTSSLSPAQSLFCNTVLSISCNLLTSILKVKKRMVVSVSVVYLCDLVADWKLWVPLPSIKENTIPLIAAWEKIKIQSIVSTNTISLLHYHFKKKRQNHKSRTVWTSFNISCISYSRCWGKWRCWSHLSAHSATSAVIFHIWPKQHAIERLYWNPDSPRCPRSS